MRFSLPGQTWRRLTEKHILLPASHGKVHSVLIDSRKSALCDPQIAQTAPFRHAAAPGRCGATPRQAAGHDGEWLFGVPGGSHGLGRSTSEGVERQASQPEEDRGGEVLHVAKSPGSLLDGLHGRVCPLEVGVHWPAADMVGDPLPVLPYRPGDRCFGPAVLTLF